jgi:polyisoprenoid-binding protein YceI
MNYLLRLTGSVATLNPDSKWLTAGVGIVALLFVLACGGTEQPAQTSIPEPAPTAASNLPSSEPATPATETLEPGSITITVQDGTTARYIVGEQLARQSLPNDAVGETSSVTGAIIFSDDGSVVPGASEIIVGVNSLRSDESRRDGFLRRSSIETSRFPEARFAVTGTEGLAWPLPSEGSASFTLLGDMTIRDVTRPVTLSVDAEFTKDSIAAKASTTITFDQFEMSKPRLAFILSVEDEIRLELDIQASILTGN